MIKRKNLLYKRIYLPLLLFCLPLSSCTPEKARALRLGAVQFKAESISCIDSIENMHKQELEPPPRSQELINQEFIESLFAEDDSNIINIDDIEHALEPNKVNLSKEANQKWQDFINKLTLQYSSFAAIYSDLEQGSFFAQESIVKSEEYAKDLTIQMAYFANLINKHPPVLLQYRTDIAVEFTKLKRKYNWIMT